MVFKNHTAIMVSSKCHGEACTSFEIFHALFDVRPCMRRSSQALQIDCKTWSVNMHQQFKEFFERNGCKQNQVSKESAR